MSERDREPASIRVRILFVCLGNICRSPSAEAVFRALVERRGLAHRIEASSAGTHAFRPGAPAHPRSVAAAAARGYPFHRHRARRLVEEDFERYDRIIAMDRDNLAFMRAASPVSAHGKLELFLRHDPGPEIEVPDPYMDEAPFDEVLELIERAARGLLDAVVEEWG